VGSTPSGASTFKLICSLVDYLLINRRKTYVPVHEVKVKVLETQVLQGVLDGQLDVFGVVVELEKLGGDPKLLSGDTGSLDTLSDLSLVSVSPGAADSQRYSES
jgi:hypothetical protein